MGRRRRENNGRVGKQGENFSVGEKRLLIN
jgi:hypothetical protein